MDCALRCNLLKRKNLSDSTQLFEMMACKEEVIKILFKQNSHSRNLVKTLIASDSVAFMLSDTTEI